MAAVAVQIRGTLYDLQSKTSRQVVLMGEASLIGLEVGGGPIIPGGEPPQIWGPTDPRPGYGLPGDQPGIWPSPGHPAHPIAPGGRPPGTWGGAGEPFPGYGLPEPPPGYPGQPPEGATKPPPEGQAGWGYYDSRWGYFPGPQDAGPKA